MKGDIDRLSSKKERNKEYILLLSHTHHPCIFVYY